MYSSRRARAAAFCRQLLRRPARDRLTQKQAEAIAAKDPGQSDTPLATPISVSSAAEATRPAFTPKAAYPRPQRNAREWRHGRVHGAGAHRPTLPGKNFGAWGYAIVDALAADNAGQAQDVLEAMAKHTPQPEILSADHLRPLGSRLGGPS